MTDRHVKDLKPGDEVAVWYLSSWRRDTIDRLTRTQIVIRNQRFSRETGRQIGGYPRHRITPAPDETA